MNYQVDHSRRSNLEDCVALLVLIVTACSIIYYCTIDLEAKLAWNGFSPTYFVALVRFPHWFQNNYPSGAEQLLKSAPNLVYFAADRLNFSIVDTMRGMIGLEVTLVAVVAAWGVRQLYPDSSWAAAFLTALLLIAGNIANADLGRWRYPFYGWAYSFAYAAAIVAVVSILQRALVRSALALGFAIAAHVTLGLIAGTFVAAVFVATWKQYPLRTMVYASATLAVSGGIWLAYILLSSSVSGNEIPQELFVEITKLLGAHWHPVSMGILWERHWEILFPFLSVCLLIPVYCTNSEEKFGNRDLLALSGFATLFILTIAGLWISEKSSSPLLIKLALQRSSTLLLLIAAIFIVPRLWNDATSGAPLHSALAIMALFSGVVGNGGISILLSIAIATTSLFQLIRRGDYGFRFFVIAAIVGSVLVLFTIYWSAGIAAHWSNYFGLVYADHPKIAFTVMGILWLLITINILPSLARCSLLCAIGVYAVLWASSLNTLSESSGRTKANDYLVAQRWAHDHTPHDSLFLVNPVHFYGWREFSLRPSFGNVREWLYNGWIYDSNKTIFDEGWARAKTFGVDPAYYFGPAKRKPAPTETELYAAFEHRYKSITLREMIQLRRDFGIKYVVVERSVRDVPDGLSPVYENSSYAIVAIPAPKTER